MDKSLNLVFIGPHIWGHLPSDQVRIACEEIYTRLAHLDPLLVMKDGFIAKLNPDLGLEISGNGFKF